MNYEAVTVSISEQLVYETSKKAPVVIIDNQKGLYDLFLERAKKLNSNNKLSKATKSTSILGVTAIVLSLTNPVTAIGELVFLGASAVGMGIVSKAYSTKELKQYKVLDIDEECKEIVLIHKSYKRKKDTYHRKVDNDGSIQN